MSMEPALPLCPRCRGAAVVPSRMRNAPEVTVWTCSACSLSWSGLPCESRVCRQWATVMCGQCNKPKCPNHGFHGRAAVKNGICDACVRRTADLMKRPKRETSWSRLERLGQ